MKTQKRLRTKFIEILISVLKWLKVRLFFSTSTTTTLLLLYFLVSCKVKNINKKFNYEIV